MSVIFTTFKITENKAKTKAEFWKNVQVGDEIKVSLDLNQFKRKYATVVSLENMRNNESINCNVLRMKENLSKFTIDKDKLEIYADFIIIRKKKKFKSQIFDFFEPGDKFKLIYKLDDHSGRQPVLHIEKIDTRKSIHTGYSSQVCKTLEKMELERIY